jgi:hypothetical protein
MTMVQSTSAAEPSKPRGRPRKPTHESPVDLDSFDAVTAAIQAIPPDESAEGNKPAKPGRNAAKDRARAIVAKDARLSRSAIVVFNRVLDEMRWKEGRCCYSLQWYADNCGLKRNTVTRAFKALKAAGHVLRRRRPSTGGDWDHSETTLPVLASAWEEIETEVGPGKAGWVPENTAGGGSEKVRGWVPASTTALCFSL